MRDPVKHAAQKSMTIIIAVQNDSYGARVQRSRTSEQIPLIGITTAEIVYLWLGAHVGGQKTL